MSACVPMSPPQPEPAGALGIDAPDRLGLTGGFELGGEPALDVVAVHQRTSPSSPLRTM